MLKRFPLQNPIRVTFLSLAILRAASVEAERDTKKGIPCLSTLMIISEEILPLVSRILSFKLISLNRALPITLSRAL